MMNIKFFSVDLSKTNNRKIIHGHVPQTLANIEEAISNNAIQIPIDGGCVYYPNEEFGKLIAYNIDEKGLIVQPNIDKPNSIKDGFPLFKESLFYIVVFPNNFQLPILSNYELLYL